MTKTKKTTTKLIDHGSNASLFIGTRIHIDGGCGNSIIINCLEQDEFQIDIESGDFKIIWTDYLNREELQNITDNINILLETTK